MRFVVYGAGGIGGTIGGRLVLSGHETVLICRGDHLAAVRENGLLLRTPDGDHRVAVSAVGHPNEIEWREGDVVILAMKTQDTEPALRALEIAAGAEVPVFCAQNGVENERLAARRFNNVYAMLVALPATFIVPGEVTASAAPLSGCLHSGRYEGGIDQTARDVCSALTASRFLAEPTAAPMELKYRKLIQNLGNGIEVITGQSGWAASGDLGDFVKTLRDEAERCYSAAGIVATTAEDYTERVSRHYRAMEVGGQARSGSSTFQSILRGHQTTEVDYLNGEIDLLGKLHGVPTPANSVVREVATRMAANGEPPGSVTIGELKQLVTMRGAAARSS